MRYQEFAESSMCPECGGPSFSNLLLAEKQDACYHKVKSRYKVWPSAYASGALVQCRKKGAANWGNKSEGVAEGGFDNASPMTKDSIKQDKISSLKNLITIAKEKGRQLRVQELELELKKLQGVAEAVTLDRSKNPNYPNDPATVKHRLDTAKAILSNPNSDSDSRRAAAAIIAKLEKGVAEGSGDGYYYLQGGIERSKKFASEAEAMAHSKRFFQLARVRRVTLKYKEPGQPAVVVKEFTFKDPEPPKSQMSWGDFYLQGKKQGVEEGKYKCTCHPGDADPDCPVHGLEPMDVGDALDVKEGLNEFAPPGSNDGDDGFSEETLKRLAAQWYNGDEDPRVERTLMAAGWEIGQDEGYDDEPGVFVVQAGDANGNSYLSWPAHELKQGVAEAGNPQMVARRISAPRVNTVDTSAPWVQNQIQQARRRKKEFDELETDKEKFDFLYKLKTGKTTHTIKVVGPAPDRFGAPITLNIENYNPATGDIELVGYARQGRAGSQELKYRANTGTFKYQGRERKGLSGSGFNYSFTPGSSLELISQSPRVKAQEPAAVAPKKPASPWDILDKKK